MALKDIKAKISSTNRTHKVTRAMEAVSAVKMRRTQQAALAGRPYARAALAILARLSGTTELASHPLAAVRDVKRAALIIITSDKGLAGSVNSGVVKAAVEAVAESLPREEVTIYALGKKGEAYFTHRGYRLAEAFENASDNVPLDVVDQLASRLTAAFTEGVYDEVLVAYSRFRSTFEQAPTVNRLLPLSLVSVSQLVEDIVPAKGKWSDTKDTSVAPSAYVMESDSADLLSAVVPRLVTASLYHMLLEAKASEHSARMVAMKNASDKSKEMVHNLTRTYNKVRQAAITREVSEIVSGREALAT
ncbi:MAG: ATP synthase F1 subunit gamma [Parcubacteria group bacterium 21-54-25]|nr:MAG: ATP synthase F1 subunit gamma [Parcubacteria group bacterium 21-54-25]HQU07666.1 ATP synthase F1 subunit gamma [Candidatus Paceibacterota bacterium]